VHRPITTCSLTTTPEHLPAQAAFSRSAIGLKTFELGMPSSFAIASGAALSPERRHTIAARVDSHRPTKPHATGLRRRLSLMDHFNGRRMLELLKYAG
jgi:hypothetical protein